MTQQDNIQIVKDIYDAVGRGDLDAHHYWQLRDGRVARFRGSEASAHTAEAFAR